MGLYILHRCSTLPFGLQGSRLYDTSFSYRSFRYKTAIVRFMGGHFFIPLRTSAYGESSSQLDLLANCLCNYCLFDLLLLFPHRTLWALVGVLYFLLLFFIVLFVAKLNFRRISPYPTANKFFGVRAFFFL